MDQVQIQIPAIIHLVVGEKKLRMQGELLFEAGNACAALTEAFETDFLRPQVWVCEAVILSHMAQFWKTTVVFGWD